MDEGGGREEEGGMSIGLKRGRKGELCVRREDGRMRGNILFFKPSLFRVFIRSFL